MPISAENRKRYPKDWKAIRSRILVRARHACEGSPLFPDCRVPNYAYRNTSTGEFTEDPGVAADWMGDGQMITRIVLTIAHLDHTPENCDESNLKAWCQKCHLAYDREHHSKNARATRQKVSCALPLI